VYFLKVTGGITLLEYTQASTAIVLVTKSGGGGPLKTALSRTLDQVQQRDIGVAWETRGVISIPGMLGWSKTEDIRLPVIWESGNKAITYV
jgi:hypothetical protein